jgi:hypothetical protein
MPNNDRTLPPKKKREEREVGKARKAVAVPWEDRSLGKGKGIKTNKALNRNTKKKPG